MTDNWQAVDEYIAGKLLGVDEALEAALAANAAGGLPPIDVSAPQGRMLELFARMIGAKRVLEVGTLGGYSTICLARALPADGRVVTLEIDPHHAEVARSNIARAGFADTVDIRVGPAIRSLEAMTAAGKRRSTSSSSMPTSRATPTTSAPRSACRGPAARSWSTTSCATAR